MELRKQLQELEPLMKAGLTPENLERIEKIKASITTDTERAELEAFVEHHLLETEDEVEDLYNETIRLQMGEVLKIVNLSYIAKKYFGKTQAWLSQRINGCTVNGKKATFNNEEINTLNRALKDIAQIIGSHTVHA
ncbi:MAG: DUF5053 domain-containing protein [Oscillospiraceae bacterium]|nr:DUF5053 domain-containing protein [Oscillospiraceae bacterium]